MKKKPFKKKVMTNEDEFFKYIEENRPKNLKFLEISYKDGHIQTAFNPYNGCNVIDIGIALASATRVISEAFRDMMNLPKGELEQIQAAITHHYNLDMGLESMGEEENTRDAKSWEG